MNERFVLRIIKIDGSFTKLVITHVKNEKSLDISLRSIKASLKKRNLKIEDIEDLQFIDFPSAFRKFLDIAATIPKGKAILDLRTAILRFKNYGGVLNEEDWLKIAQIAQNQDQLASLFRPLNIIEHLLLNDAEESWGVQALHFPKVSEKIWLFPSSTAQLISRLIEEENYKAIIGFFKPKLADGDDLELISFENYQKTFKSLEYISTDQNIYKFKNDVGIAWYVADSAEIIESIYSKTILPKNDQVKLSLVPENRECFAPVWLGFKLKRILNNNDFKRTEELSEIDFAKLSENTVDIFTGKSPNPLMIKQGKFTFNDNDLVRIVVQTKMQRQLLITALADHVGEAGRFYSDRLRIVNLANKFVVDDFVSTDILSANLLTKQRDFTIVNRLDVYPALTCFDYIALKNGQKFWLGTSHSIPEILYISKTNGVAYLLLDFDGQVKNLKYHDGVFSEIGSNEKIELSDELEKSVKKVLASREVVYPIEE